MGIKHIFTNAKTDDADTTIVRPVNWNDIHCKVPFDAAGSLYDGFDTTDTSAPIGSYTTLGSPDSLDSNSTQRSNLYVADTGAGSNNLVGVYKAWSPSAANFVECWMTDWLSSISVSQYAGMFVGEAGGTGKFVFMGLGRYGASFDDRIVIFTYTNRTTFAGEPYSGVGGSPFHPPIGFRIVYNSSTSLDFFYSYGGRLWRKVVAAYNPGFTIGLVGLGGDMSASGFRTEVLFDYLNNG